MAFTIAVAAAAGLPATEALVAAVLPLAAVLAPVLPQVAVTVPRPEVPREGLAAAAAAAEAVVVVLATAPPAALVALLAALAALGPVATLKAKAVVGSVLQRGRLEVECGAAEERSATSV